MSLWRIPDTDLIRISSLELIATHPFHMTPEGLFHLHLIDHFSSFPYIK
jgi:hypothetical protein